MLARAGHALVMIGRPATVQALREAGLRLRSARFDFSVPVAADTDAAALQGCDWVLCCVKSGDSEAAAQQMAPHLAPGTPVLSLQNGVDNAARLQALLPAQPVVAAAVYVAAAMEGPALVRHHGRGDLVLAPFERSAAVVQAFVDAGVPTRVDANVRGALWAKLVLNCAWNGLSAITRLPYGRLLRAHGVEDVLRDLADEALAVARACGVDVPGDPWQAVLDIARTMPGQPSSTAQDLARGRRTEIEHLNGLVVREGAAHGVPTPANRLVLTLVRLLECPPAEGAS